MATSACGRLMYRREIAGFKPRLSWPERKGRKGKEGKRG
jgi:hypothetical protein